jgi:hypothetical protein
MTAQAGRLTALPRRIRNCHAAETDCVAVVVGLELRCAERKFISLTSRASSDSGAPAQTVAASRENNPSARNRSSLESVRRMARRGTARSPAALMVSAALSCVDCSLLYRGPTLPQGRGPLVSRIVHRVRRVGVRARQVKRDVSRS